MADWKIGDLAVCINAKSDASDPLAYKLVERKTYRVAAAGKRSGDRAFSLGFRGIADAADVSKVYGFSAHRFRKITKASETFTASIRACRPAHSPAPVA